MTFKQHLLSTVSVLALLVATNGCGDPENRLSEEIPEDVVIQEPDQNTGE